MFRIREYLLQIANITSSESKILKQQFRWDRLVWESLHAETGVLCWVRARQVSLMQVVWYREKFSEAICAKMFRLFLVLSRDKVNVQKTNLYTV